MGWMRSAREVWIVASAMVRGVLGVDFDSGVH